MSLPVKEFWKSVNSWGSLGQEFGVLFFDSQWRSVWRAWRKDGLQLTVRNVRRAKTAETTDWEVRSLL